MMRFQAIQTFCNGIQRCTMRRATVGRKARSSVRNEMYDTRRQRLVLNIRISEGSLCVDKERTAFQNERL